MGLGKTIQAIAAAEIISHVGPRPLVELRRLVDAAQDLVVKILPQPLGKDRNAAFLKAQLAFWEKTTKDLGIEPE